METLLASKYLLNNVETYRDAASASWLWVTNTISQIFLTCAHQKLNTDDFRICKQSAVLEGARRKCDLRITWSTKTLWSVFFASIQTIYSKITIKTHNIKGTINDKRNLQTTLQIKKNTFQSQHVPLFSKNHIILTEK